LGCFAGGRKKPPQLRRTFTVHKPFDLGEGHSCLDAARAGHPLGQLVQRFGGLQAVPGDQGPGTPARNTHSANTGLIGVASRPGLAPPALNRDLAAGGNGKIGCLGNFGGERLYS
jgi:hypothetical protein